MSPYVAEYGMEFSGKNVSLVFTHTRAFAATMRRSDFLLAPLSVAIIPRHGLQNLLVSNDNGLTAIAQAGKEIQTAMYDARNVAMTEVLPSSKLC